MDTHVTPGPRRGPRLSRRSLLGWSAAAAAASGTTLLGAATAHAAGAPATPGSGLLLDSPVVDLDDGSDPLIREKPLHNSTVLQSFGFDNVNGRIYLAQVMEGGIQLPGETAPVSGTDRSIRGDLCITRWDLSGNQLGSMYARGLGHGVSFGVEPFGAGAYLWTEADAVPTSDGKSSRGQRLARFKFVDGAVVDSSSSALVKHTPVPGSTANTASVDPVYGRLVHRYGTDGGMRYAVHDLDLARLGIWNAPLADIAEPAVTVPAQYGTPDFQGYAVAGRYLYLMHGNAYGTTQQIDLNGDGTAETVVVSPDGEGNTFLTSVDLGTGAILETRPTRAAYTLTYREPEGLAVQVPSAADPATFRLCMGFASGDPGARQATIYVKDALVRP
ncbi:teichoic acid biosynthesis protein C [Streptacidiphilus sp. ASG 303]|uniref:phage baseplate protein n=1 Tax=Streptacidiphilus sp. ASG 303 TaxID=2896847 RepID=UPI001E3254A5|nr:teichoic acid biosynthesis protein C [Streptacidiphilus sp. ASG 303]MCD0484147.1 teichoic acid biosynthesis protein C [Streptacidiphilus sp. ASG 303]